MSLIEVFSSTDDSFVISIYPIRCIAVVKYDGVGDPELKLLIFGGVLLAELRFSSQVFVKVQERDEIWLQRILKVHELNTLHHLFIRFYFILRGILLRLLFPVASIRYDYSSSNILLARLLCSLGSFMEEVILLILSHKSML